MSVPRDLGEGRGDLGVLGDRGPLEHLADARRGDAAGDPPDRGVEQVEEPSVDLVGQPPAVRRAPGALLGDQDLVGLGELGLDRVPVDARAVEPAQVDDLGVDVALSSRRRSSTYGVIAEVGEDVRSAPGRVAPPPCRPAGSSPSRRRGLAPRTCRGRRAPARATGSCRRRAVFIRPDVVERRAGRHDPPAGRCGEHPGRVHRVLRAVARCPSRPCCGARAARRRSRRTCAEPWRSG